MSRETRSGERRAGYIDLSTDVALISQKVNEMHEELFGNGQPGFLEVTRRRIGRIEAAFFIGAGVLVGLGLLNINPIQLAIKAIAPVGP